MASRDSTTPHLLGLFIHSYTQFKKDQAPITRQVLCLHEGYT